MSGTYVTVEGIDGAGKTTLVESLERELDDAAATAEPNDSMFTGQAVRTAISRDTFVATDPLLFAADRAEHLNSLVEPALRTGVDIISDRGHDSMYAYQVPRLMDELGINGVEAVEWLDAIYGPWNTEPDVTIWVDVPVDVAIHRMSGEEKWARKDYLRRVRERYEMRYDADPGRIRWVDGDQPEEDVLADALDVLEGVVR